MVYYHQSTGILNYEIKNINQKNLGSKTEIIENRIENAKLIASQIKIDFNIDIFFRSDNQQFNNSELWKKLYQDLNLMTTMNEDIDSIYIYSTNLKKLIDDKGYYNFNAFHDNGWFDTFNKNKLSSETVILRKKQTKEVLIMGFSEWFTFKTAKQRAREEKMFAKWAFPYGDAQKEKVTQIIRELMPKEDPKTGLALFLMGRQAYRGSFKDDPEDLAERTDEDKMAALDRTLESQLFGQYKKFLPYYKVLVLADVDVDESLNYPSVEELRARAEALPVKKRR